MFEAYGLFCGQKRLLSTKYIMKVLTDFRFGAQSAQLIIDMIT